MPSPHPPQFRARVIALIRAAKQAKPAKPAAVELGIHRVTLSTCYAKTTSITGSAPEFPRASSLSCGRLIGGIKSLETELGIVRQAAKFLSEDKPRPKGSTR